VLAFLSTDTRVKVLTAWPVSPQACLAANSLVAVEAVPTWMAVYGMEVPGALVVEGAVPVVMETTTRLTTLQAMVRPTPVVVVVVDPETHRLKNSR
jgi:hypothetical protein